MAMVSSLQQMDQKSMRVSGRMTFMMVMEKRLGQMGHSLKEYFNRARKTEMDLMCGQMGPVIAATG